MKMRGMIPLMLFLSMLLFAACYQPSGPTPEPPLSPPEPVPVPDLVIIEQELIPSPAPCSQTTPPVCPPEECNYIQFTRYRPPETEGSPKAVEAILVLIPGFMGGANSFDYLGRKLVAMAETDEAPGSLEVWAVERRTNCLEDLTGLNAAEAGGDPQIAVDYLYNGAEENGKTFQGFLEEEDLPFLSEFGLALLTNDVWKIITDKIPEKDDRKKVVFIGGHSAGGGFTSYFAGWDFDGDAGTIDDAGYNNCAGLIGLDGRVGARSGPYMEEAAYTQRVTNIRSGAAPRLGLFPGVTPEALALFEIVAMYAHLSPDDPSSMATGIPYSQKVAGLIKLLHSRSLDHFLTGVPAFKHFRYTNEATLGIFFDDNFNPVGFLETSMGFLQGGPVVAKNFPGGLADMLGIWGIKADGVFIPWDAGPPGALGTGPLYSWVNFDEVGNALDPDYQDTTGTVTYTNWREEVSDIQDVAVSLYRGPTNFPEWYYTSRLGLDTEAALGSYSSTFGLYFLYNDSIEDLPIINIYASDIEGYNHLDVLFAAVDRPDHRPNEVFSSLMNFVFSNSGGSVLIP